MSYEEQKAMLDKIYYKLGNQQFDFELSIMNKEDDNTTATKWRKYSELCFETDDPKNRWFIERVNNRTILGNEVVLDLEDPNLYSSVISRLRSGGYFFTAWHTGNGYHFHLLFNRELLEQEKLEIINTFGCDHQKASKRCMIALENAIHWKHHTLKRLIEDNSGINYLEKKEVEREKIILMTKFSPVPYAETLIAENEFIYDKNKQLFRFDNQEKIWKTDAEQYIRTKLRKELMGEEQQKKYYADEVIAYLKDVSYNEKAEFNKNPYLIAFKNKVYNLKTGKFNEIKPEYYITTKLDIDIDGPKECPNIDKFFEDCLGERKEILYETAAYALFKEYPYQKIFFIYGPANRGKSVFLNLLEAFIGAGNYSSVEPQEIQRDKISVAPMWRKLANIVSDINYDALENINLIKKLTGGDTINIRQMHKEPFPVKIYAKQIYSTNKLPIVREKTNAWYRRVYLIGFFNEINKENIDPFLLEKITSEEELKGFAYQCLQRLKNLYKNKFIFTYDMDIEKIANLYEQLSNPVSMFIAETCKETREGTIFKYDFEERLNNWLKANHFPVMTKTQINQYMREKYNESKREAPDWSTGSLKSVNWRVWVGLGWKTNDNGTDFPDFHTNNFFSIYREKISNTMENGEDGEDKPNLIDYKQINKFNVMEDIPALANPFNPKELIGPYSSGNVIILNEPMVAEVLVNGGKLKPNGI